MTDCVLSMNNNEKHTAAAIDHFVTLLGAIQVLHNAINCTDQRYEGLRSKVNSLTRGCRGCQIYRGKKVICNT